MWNTLHKETVKGERSISSTTLHFLHQITLHFVVFLSLCIYKISVSQKKKAFKMAPRRRASSSSQAAQPRESLSVAQHQVLIYKRPVVIERVVRLRDFNELEYEEALKTDATISLPHGILLTQFLHAMMVPESGDEPRALPLGSINKTTLSKSIAQTRRALQAARVARVRRQEQPEEAMEGEDPGQSSTQGLGAQRPSWMDKGRDMDVGWKKEVAALKEVLKGVATGAELFPLTERVVLIEEHLRHVRHVLKLTDDDDEK
ncbi:hypothetical protein CJ030_MR2G013134 [Morella rubra]|uniref:Uncharacterized protein n=1 Tax=Morella rubra TaxID=262757 RepID=A0A6A1WEX7_9ROSI|nr:hypothetical protein CJ030_MR2G013134 [Morella rubra]